MRSTKYFMSYPIPNKLLADGLSYNRNWLTSLDFLKKYVCKSFNDFWSHEGDIFSELSMAEITKAKQNLLILDCSWISFGIEKIYNLIHTDCIKYNVPEKNVVLLTANLNKEHQNYSNWFANSNFKNKIKTFPFPVYIQMAQEINKGVEVSSVKYNKFVTFSRFPREHRNVMNYALLANKYPVDLSQSKIEDSIIQEQCKKFNVRYNDNLLCKDFVIDRNDFDNHEEAILWTESTSNFLSHYKFILVQDTNIEDFGFFITEKVWKSMLYERPIIIWGQPGVNNYLKEMGFKLYDNYFDLTFDNEIDPAKRLHLLLKELNNVSKRMIEKNWHRKDLQTIKFNKEYLLSGKCLKKWVKPLKVI